MAETRPEKLRETAHTPIKGIAFRAVRNPRNGRLLIGGQDGRILEWDPAEPKTAPVPFGPPAPTDAADPKAAPAPTAVHSSYVLGLAANDRFAVSGSYDRKLVWWDLDSRRPVRTVEGAHEKWIRNLALSPDGRILASVADDMVCRLWDADEGKLLRELRGHQPITPNDFPSMLFSCSFSPDGKLLATADKIGHIVVWDVASGSSVATCESPEHYTWDPVQRRHSIGGVRTAVFSPDGKHLAAGGIAKIGNVDHLEGKALVQLFDWKTGEKLHKFEHAKIAGLVEKLVWEPSGKWLLAVGGAGGGFLIFMDPAAKTFGRDEDAKFHVHDVLLSPAGDQLTCVGHGAIAAYDFAA
jgi:WD40 repeat protein